MLHPQDVAVILLNYNGAQDTIACLHSLYSLETLPGAIIVVDNASVDDSVTRIMSAWRQWSTPRLVHAQNPGEKEEPAKAVLLQLDENNGYASGNNAGIRLAKSLTSCTAYWILNNDTEPDRYALNTLCARYNQAKSLALVGSTLVFSYDEETIQCAGGGKLVPYLGLTGHLHQGEKIKDLDTINIDETEKELGYITGASLLLHEEALRRIGMIREDFFLYLEDTDFSIRARKAGIPLLWARDSIVFHKEGGTTGAASANNAYFQRPLWVDYLMLRNRARLVRDHYPLGIPLLCASYLAVAFKRLLRKQPDRVPLVFKALWHGLAARWANRTGCADPPASCPIPRMLSTVRPLSLLSPAFPRRRHRFVTKPATQNMPHSQTIPQETGRGKHLSTHTGISGHPGRSGPFRGRQQ